MAPANVHAALAHGLGDYNGHNRIHELCDRPPSSSTSERLELEGRRVATIGQLASTARARGIPILRQHTHTSTLWLVTSGIRLTLRYRSRRRFGETVLINGERAIS